MILIQDKIMIVKVYMGSEDYEWLCIIGSDFVPNLLLDSYYIIVCLLHEYTYNNSSLCLNLFLNMVLEQRSLW